MAEHAYSHNMRIAVACKRKYAPKKIRQSLPPLFLLAGQRSYVRIMRAEEGGPGTEAVRQEAIPDIICHAMIALLTFVLSTRGGRHCTDTG